jgi:hypothetical protein
MLQRCSTNNNRTNFEGAVEVRRRELAWIERKNFQGWACSECAWTFNPSGPLVGESLDDMKMHYEQQRDKEFMSAPSTREPRKIPVSQITRGLNAL